MSFRQLMRINCDCWQVYVCAHGMRGVGSCTSGLRVKAKPGVKRWSESQLSPTCCCTRRAAVAERNADVCVSKCGGVHVRHLQPEAVVWQTLPAGATSTQEAHCIACTVTVNRGCLAHGGDRCPQACSALRPKHKYGCVGILSMLGDELSVSLQARIDI